MRNVISTVLTSFLITACLACSPNPGPSDSGSPNPGGNPNGGGDAGTTTPGCDSGKQHEDDDTHDNPCQPKKDDDDKDKEHEGDDNH
jgi:hypothetical protein